jgi:uncharacterized protein (DUF924 family)
MVEPKPNDILELWFSDRVRPLWFSRSDAFDEELRTRFGALVASAIDGGFEDWRTDPESTLALVLALDQFPRNLYRGTPRAFAGDRRARDVVSAAIARGDDQRHSLERRMFLYMPFQHSEELADQERAVELFTRWANEHQGEERAKAEEDLKYAHRHCEIIRRFGRFPHRNATLGRTSTPEEIAFLDEPMSSF